jgi:hypothetical protein
MKKFMVIAAMIAAFGLGTAAAFAATSDKPPSPPGQPECEHGNSQAQCKDDPNPDHGKDCEAHGNQGGQNEDHCKNESTPTETTPTETTPTTPTQTTPTTPTETTPTTPTETTPTTPTTTTPTTPTETKSTETTPSQPSSTPSESTSPAATTPAETTAEPTEQEEQVFTPPAEQVKSTKVKSQSGPEVVAAPAAVDSATKPSTAAQPAPFTP